MKKLPDKAGIVEQIVTELGRPLRQHRSEAKAYEAVERAIETIEQLREAHREKPKPETGAELEYRNWCSRSGPRAASIRKAAKSLLKALEPSSGGLPVELKDPFREWLGSKDGPPPSIKYYAAEFAHKLVNEFSQKPPTTTFDGQASEIGTLLYQAVSGEEEARGLCKLVPF